MAFQRGFRKRQVEEISINSDTSDIDESCDDDLLRFLPPHFKSLYTSERVSVFSHRLFSLILAKRFQRYRFIEQIEIADGSKLDIVRLPQQVSRVFEKQFIDMNNFLSEKKINGISLVMVNLATGKILETYKFCINVGAEKISHVKDYNGDMITNINYDDTITGERPLLLNMYRTVGEYCDKLKPFTSVNIVPLLRFHFLRRSDRKEYEKGLFESSEMLPVRMKPAFEVANKNKVLLARKRKRLNMAVINNSII
uniref:HORMA domain-containing protein n=1 Tax=Parastrongyloides trichosuri TaxID=131310 RepID=A0A0N5A651_PARTI